MTLDDIIYHFRILTGDTNSDPYLWEESLVESYVDLAEIEACSRKPLLTSNSIADLCVIPVVSNTAVYARHKNTRQVYSASLANSETNLQLTDVTELNHIEPNWRTLTGEPRFLIVEDSSYELVPAPAEATTLTLRVSYVPLTNASASGVLSIDDAHHYMLLFYMLFLAYSKRDADTENPAKALESEAIFAAYFGAKPDVYTAKSIRQVRETNRSNGWM